MQEKKPDTKAQIFNTALRLFAANGVEHVSMRNLADAVGIKAASIYNHYLNKEQIVESCYKFFLESQDIGRLNKEQHALVLQNGTKEEVVNLISDQLPGALDKNLIYAMTMVVSRIYTDAKATEIYAKSLDHFMQFLTEFCDLGIKLGRFEEFNIRGFVMLALSVRLFAVRSAIIRPEVLFDWDSAQQEMISELMKILPFKY